MKIEKKEKKYILFQIQLNFVKNVQFRINVLGLLLTKQEYVQHVDFQKKREILIGS